MGGFNGSRRTAPNDKFVNHAIDNFVNHAIDNFTCVCFLSDEKTVGDVLRRMGKELKDLAGVAAREKEKNRPDWRPDDDDMAHFGLAE